MTAFAKTFGRRVCFARLEFGWTQTDLAAKSGVTRTVIAKYELGLSVPSAERARALADALGMTLDVLTAPEVTP